MRVDSVLGRHFPLYDYPWPSPQKVQDALLKHGFCSGQELRSTESLLRSVPHGIPIEKFSALPIELDPAKRCAVELLRFLDLYEDVSQATGAIQISKTALIGPHQMELLDLLNSVHYHPIIHVGYQSLAYQALLFATRYLNGTLLDALGRFTVPPPGYSDHGILDGALDVEDSTLFLLHLLKVRSQLGMSLIQPYLFHPHMAHEPRHWRCILSEVEQCDDQPGLPAFVPANYSDETINRLIQFFSTEDSSPTRQGDHIFVAGLSRSGASVCIGSLQETFAASLKDALAAVGSGWDALYITIPEGYTPIFDNKVLPQDIGRSIFKAVDAQSGRTAYLTGQSCCVEKVNTSLKVVQALEAKGQFPNSEAYKIHKSRTRDIAYLSSQAILPCAYGLPILSLERDADAPSLIVDGYTSWLLNRLPGSLPVYASADYSRTYSLYRDSTRYAFLSFILAKYRSRLHPQLHVLTDQLRGIYCEGANWHTLLQGKVLAGDPTPEATVVFLTHMLQLSGLHREAARLWEAYAPRVREEVTAICKDAGNLNGLLFLGHLCDLFASALPSEDTRPTDFGLTPAIVEHFCATASTNLIYARALSQLLQYAASVKMDIDTQALATNLVERLIRHPGSPVPLEQGAFAGYESFLSALPLEALLNVRPLLPQDEANERVITMRVKKGLAFLRKLQFQYGSGYMTPYPHLLEGALHFSLVDHHFRMDYGLHALNIAVQILSSTGDN